MSARTFAIPTLAATFLAGVLPISAAAADPQLLSLVMPDAKVLAGVNVESAKNSLFGQYVLNTIQPDNRDLQELADLTGFDPRRDVRELLVASNGVPGSKTGLALARGSFDPARIAGTATSHGATTESYKGVTLLLDPQGQHGIAFLDSTLVLAGDVASVKAAIDRQSAPMPLPSSVAVKVQQWSTAQDAWVISAVPPASLKPTANAPQIPGLTNQDVFTKIQQAASGVKFGNNVTVTSEADMATAQDATSLGDVVKFLANFAAAQAGQKNPEIAALAQSLQVTTSGAVLNVVFSLPESQLQELVKPKNAVARKRVERRGERR
jgi:hypothetical protein